MSVSSVPLVRNQNLDLTPPQVVNEGECSILRPMLGVAATVGLITALYFGSWLTGIASGICLLYLLLTCCCHDAKPLADRNVQRTQANGLSFTPQTNSVATGSVSTNRTFTALSSSGLAIPPLPAESLALLQARSAGTQFVSSSLNPPAFNPASLALTSRASGSSGGLSVRGVTGDAPTSSTVSGAGEPGVTPSTSTGWFTRLASWFSRGSSSAPEVASLPISTSEQALLDQLPSEPAGSQSRAWSDRRRDVLAYTRLLNRREQIRRDLSHIQGLPAPTALIHDIGRLAHLDFPNEFRNIRAEIDRLTNELSLARQQRLGMPAPSAPPAPASSSVAGDQFYVEI